MVLTVRSMALGSPIKKNVFGGVISPYPQRKSPSESSDLSTVHMLTEVHQLWINEDGDEGATARSGHCWIGLFGWSVRLAPL